MRKLQARMAAFEERVESCPIVGFLIMSLGIIALCAAVTMLGAMTGAL